MDQTRRIDLADAQTLAASVLAGPASGVVMALSSALRSKPMLRARLARSVEAVPSAVPGARAAFEMETLLAVLASGAADPLVVDRGRTTPVPVPRTAEAVRATLGSGQSVVVRRAERGHGGLGQLADEASAVLGGEPHVQLFVTPAGGQSFAWHYDAEDVVILQTLGEKDYFFRQNTQSPDARGPLDFSSFANERSPLATCTLIEGDVLYLPRGWWHVARGRTEAWSISIGVTTERAGSLPPTSASAPAAE